MEEYLKLLSSIPDEKKIDMLRKNWMSHDARWQMQVVLNNGWELGNKLNHEAIKQMGQVMMHRMMKTLGISEVKNIDEARNIVMAIVALSYPPPPINVYQMERQSDSSMLIKCQSCSTYNNVKKVRATRKYECGCFSLREGFFKVLNLTLEQECHKNLMKGDDECEILIKVKEWDKSFEIKARDFNLQQKQEC